MNSNIIKTITPFIPNKYNIKGVNILTQLEELSNHIIINYDNVYKPAKYSDCLNNTINYIRDYGGKITGGYYLLSDYNNDKNFVAIKHYLVRKNDVLIDITPNEYFESLIFKETDNMNNLYLSPDKYEYFNQELIPYHNIISNL